jgi:hypothetical protein
MIKAYKDGIPGNGKPFPEGSKIVKLQWKPKKSTDAPFAVDVPDVFTQAFVMELDSKRFPKTAWLPTGTNRFYSSSSSSPAISARQPASSPSVRVPAGIRSPRRRLTNQESSGDCAARIWIGTGPYST